VATVLSKSEFFGDLHTRIHRHVETVQASFLELDLDQLNQPPQAGEWSILQCFDHLNLTHDYYRAKMAPSLANPVPASVPDLYSPSFWGRIYMHFAFNPRYSFPSPAFVRPEATSALSRDVLTNYLTRQEELLQLLAEAGQIDLRRTTLHVEKIVNFNLGDCFKVLVYHDGLHMGQAERVLQALEQQK
jgi:hypothetical protein